MEDTTNLHDLEEDTLSLSDLPLHNQEFEPEYIDSPSDQDLFEFNDLPHHNRELEPEYIDSPSDQDLFEFSIHPKPETDPTLDHNIFCGKMIPQKHESTNLFNNQSRYLSPFLNKYNSSKSLRVLTSTSKPSPSPETGSNRYHSSNYRKHMVFNGLAKVPSEMELSDIKKRQNRRTPAPMFPEVNVKEPAVSCGGSGCWGLLLPLRSQEISSSNFLIGDRREQNTQIVDSSPVSYVCYTWILKKPKDNYGWCAAVLQNMSQTTKAFFVSIINFVDHHHIAILALKEILLWLHSCTVDNIQIQMHMVGVATWWTKPERAPWLRDCEAHEIHRLKQLFQHVHLCSLDLSAKGTIEAKKLSQMGRDWLWTKTIWMAPELREAMAYNLKTQIQKSS